MEISASRIIYNIAYHKSQEPVFVLIKWCIETSIMCNLYQERFQFQPHVSDLFSGCYLVNLGLPATFPTGGIKAEVMGL